MIVRAAGDSMVIVEFERTIDPAVNQHVIDLAARLRARALEGVRDIVPGYCTLGVHLDPLRADRGALDRAIADEGQTVERKPYSPASRIVQIPVRYGGEDGPDLLAVADLAGMSADEVIGCHAAPTYRVYMLGFVPGFAYMGRVDRRIAAPRHRAPRERVPAGSVGIAAEQTGVYPMETPGGWQLIGRTNLRMFDPDREPASLLAPGDLVRFVPT
jgi:KipI family sensor histidine kinase inhibitor